MNYDTGLGWWNNQGLGTARLIQGDLTVGTSCQTFLDNTSSPVNIIIGGNLLVDGKLRIKEANSGPVTFSVVGNGLLNATGRFSGIVNGANNFVFNIISNLQYTL